MRNLKNKSEIDMTWDILGLYFQDKAILYKSVIDSYQDFIENIVPYEIKNNNTIIEYKSQDQKFYYEYKFDFSNISFKPATLENGVDFLTPRIARHRGLSYFGIISADVIMYQFKTDLVSMETTSKVIEERKDIHIAKLPIMLKSKYCTTTLVPEVSKEECCFDPGCYFIVNGNEKVVLSMERNAPNKIFVFGKIKDGEIDFKAIVNSQKDDIDGIAYVSNLTIKMKQDMTLIVSCNLFYEVPLAILLRALGLQTDLEITLNIVQDELKNDTEMLNYITLSLYQSKDEKGEIINDTESALNYLMNKISNPKMYSEDNEIRFKQKKSHLLKLLKYDLLPHIEPNMINKAKFICLMVNKLFNTFIGRVQPDDRDTFVNKRIELPGVLLGQLFKQVYNKMIKEVTTYFKKKNNSDETPLKVINQIKPMIIEQQMKSALLTGKWGMLKTKNGVARVLERLSYLQTISQFRRIITPTVDEKNSKISSMRNAHPSQYGFVCVVETPEGEKVGLVKNLSLMCSVSIPDVTINVKLKSIVKSVDSFIPIQDLPIVDYQKYCKIMINGDWLGFIKKPKEFVENITTMKLQNKINRYIGISFDVEQKEIRIYSDGGRLIRPVLRVNPETFELYLTEKMITDIDLNGVDPSKITSWEQFINKYPDVVEYIDLEQSAYSLIAMYRKDLTRTQQLIASKVQSNDKINRYTNAFNPYTHCEFHPSMLLGMTVGNIPFCNMNQAPRNVYQYAQAKQAMSIYSTAWKHRFDISNVLYHPQVPIVTTRSTEYTGSMDLPNGENVIVAIATFTGYNQEDSAILNATSVARGLFCSSYLKSYESAIEKNQVSSQDDIHTKPDKNLVMNIKADVNYEKLNQKGFVEEETSIVNGDAILGKVSPIQPSEKSTKIYKDKSEVYKGYQKAVVDKVLTGLTNVDGYEVYQMRIRSERVPQIGDKFSSRAAQKATAGLLVRKEDMPFTEQGIVPDIIVNPNCFPSRMTMGQFLETVMAKAGAVKGEFKDGTPFEERDTESICQELEDLGFNRYGYETMYSGISGHKYKAQIFIGPTYYQRLKHMVADKIHARATGPSVMLTRQPPEGRTKNGGFRFGEMERDVGIAHGTSVFLKERMVECSDGYETQVCDSCGMIVGRLRGSDSYYCNACNNHTNISRVSIPYCMKLMFQELMSINIYPHIITENTIGDTIDT
jgi:DNA-directed RNA polymerase II subunit RPB2